MLVLARSPRRVPTVAIRPWSLPFSRLDPWAWSRPGSRPHPWPDRLDVAWVPELNSAARGRL